MDIRNLPKKILVFIIEIYQKTLSFDHSFWARPDIYRVCLHYPSCSEYTKEAIDKFGVIRGTALGFFRVLRCNPLTKERTDPIPKKFSIKEAIFKTFPLLRK